MLRKLISFWNKVIAYAEINIKMTKVKRGPKSERGGEEGRGERRKGERRKGEKRREKERREKERGEKERRGKTLI